MDVICATQLRSLQDALQCFFPLTFGAEQRVDVEKEVGEFTRNIQAIQAVLEDVDERQVKEAAVRYWLEKLTNVFCKMEDLLDDWTTTEILKKQMATRNKGGEHALVTKKKQKSWILQFIRVTVRRDTLALKIKKLNDRLTKICSERSKFVLLETQIEREIEQPKRPRTSSFVDTSMIIGRINEKDTLISKLLSESSQEGKGPLVIPIVGMGGIGKTSLAQLAYKDEKVKAHFENRIWVSVSYLFEDIEIAKDILRGLGENYTPDLNDLQTFLQRISKSVKGKKFLLVLDDVWIQDHRMWEQFEYALRECAIGSRILVTTKKMEVVTMMGATTRMIHLKELSGEHCLSLFYHRAFLGRLGPPNVIRAIGEEIVTKYCKGLPLTAVTLGSHVRIKETRQEWLHVLNGNIWKLQEVEQQIFQPLLLSYYDLASEVKRCLLYCAIFPKDYEIDKDKLIEMWMSQDYLKSKGNKEQGKIGQMILDDLVMRFFFQEFEKDDEGHITNYKMHDVVHDFLQFLTTKECFIVEARDANDRTELRSDQKLRHLTIASAPDGPFKFPISYDHCKSLRTLSTLNSNISTIDSILKFKSLRTLNLSGNRIENLPYDIGRELVHLRYIDLSHNDTLIQLPNSVCTLYNLQTLRLVSCRRLKKLPEAIGELINLKHIYVEDCRALKYLPKGFRSLTSLRSLDVCPVYGGDDDEALKLADLRILDKIQGSLTIENLGDVKDAREAEEAQLGNKKQLLNLILDFKKENDEPAKSDAEILNALRPHQYLEYLCINYYHAFGFPSWMLSLQDLRVLALNEWKYSVLLPPLGILSSLEVLTISSMSSVRKVGVEFLGIETQTTLDSSSCILFPRLKKLHFEGMDLWEEWEGVERWKKDSKIKIMPCLSSLQFDSCKMLQTLPDFLCNIPSLHDILRIHQCPFLESRYEGIIYGPDFSHSKPHISKGESIQNEGLIQQDETDEYGDSDFDGIVEELP